MNQSLKPPGIALLAGTLFGSGLALSGMTDTARVLGFLNLAGDWDASLALVMIGALMVTIPGFWWVRAKRNRPLLDSQFHLPGSHSIGRRLLGGAALFGAGWGLWGYCPGPALSALVYLYPSTWVFVIAMLGGMFLAARLR